MKPGTRRWGVRAVLPVLALLGLLGMHGLTPSLGGGHTGQPAVVEALEQHGAAPGAPVQGSALGGEPSHHDDGGGDGAHVAVLCGFFLAAASFTLLLLLVRGRWLSPGRRVRELAWRAVAAAAAPLRPPPRLLALCVLRL